MKIQSSKRMDYYYILGAQYDDPPGKIKALYHSLAFALHPDKVQNEDTKSDREERFRLCTEAYRTLQDSERRNEYNIQHGIFTEPRDLKPGYDLHQRLSL